MDAGEFYRVAWEKVPTEFREGYEQGLYRMYNGVLRDSTNRNEIVRHLPLERFDPSRYGNPEDLLVVAEKVASAQAAIGGMIALSTVAIMGAIVVSTVYLAGRIENLNKRIAALQKDLADQNLVFYIDRLTIYMGTMMTLAGLCRNESALKESREYALHMLAEAGVARSRLFALVGLLQNAADTLSDSHKALLVDFMNSALDLIPKGAVIESQIAYKLECFELGDHLRLETAMRHQQCVEGYRNWYNGVLQAVVTGRGGQQSDLIARKVEVLRVSTASENRRMLEQSF